MVSDTTRLLGLDGLVVTGVEDGHDVRLVMHLSTADQWARSCPGCGVPRGDQGVGDDRAEGSRGGRQAGGAAVAATSLAV